jgi:hypothetical protein
MTHHDTSPRASGRFFSRRGWLLTAAFFVLGGLLLSAKALAQAFPEPAFIPRKFETPLADDGSTSPTLFTAWELPRDESFEGALALFMEADAFARRLSHATGDDVVESDPTILGASVGGQYLRMEWEKIEGGESRAFFSSTVSAPAEDKRQDLIPIAPRQEWPITYYLRGSAVPSPAALMTGMGDHAGIFFNPMDRPFEALQWRRTLPAPAADGSLRFDLPLGTRHFAVIDLQRPANLPPDAELAVIAGASSRSLYNIVSPRPGFERLLFFGRHDTIAARAPLLEWAPAGKYGPPALRPRSRVVNRYEIFGPEIRLFSDREYWAEPGAKIESLLLGAHRAAKVEAVAADRPAAVALEQAPDLWRVTPDEPVERLRVRVQMSWNVRHMDRLLLRMIRDDSFCEREEVVLEVAEANRVLNSGVEGLKFIQEEPAPEPRHASSRVERWMRAASRRTGRWSFAFFHLPRGLASRAIHEVEANYSAEGLSVRERIDFHVLEGVQSFPRPLRLELNRAVEPDSLKMSFDRQEPTTATIHLQESQLWPGKLATAIELEWSDALSSATLELSYRLPEEKAPAPDGSPAPLATVAGAQGRAYRLQVTAETPLKLADPGDFLPEPAPMLGRAAPLEPAPSQAFVLSSINASSKAQPFRPPAFQPAGEAETKGNQTVSKKESSDESSESPSAVPPEAPIEP